MGERNPDENLALKEETPGHAGDLLQKIEETESHLKTDSSMNEDSVKHSVVKASMVSSMVSNDIH